jgi:hypothetical protein
MTNGRVDKLDPKPSVNMRPTTAASSRFKNEKEGINACKVGTKFSRYYTTEGLTKN